MFIIYIYIRYIYISHSDYYYSNNIVTFCNLSFYNDKHTRIYFYVFHINFMMRWSYTKNIYSDTFNKT